MEKRRSYRLITLSLIGFVALWAIVTDAWGYSRYIFGNDAYKIGHYIYGYINRFIWVIPALLLIIKYNNKLKFSKSELFSRPKFSKSLILAIAIVSVYAVISMLIVHKRFRFNSERNLLLETIRFIIVGCVEEVVFRGWGYNALANVTSNRKAVIISTLWFIILHWPAYFIKLYILGTFDFVAILSQSFSALMLGIIFCWQLKKDRTLWNPIIAHSINDLIFVFLVQ